MAAVTGTARGIFVNAESRGETLVRGLRRELGTVVGIVAGLLVAVPLDGAGRPTARPPGTRPRRGRHPPRADNDERPSAGLAPARLHDLRTRLTTLATDAPPRVAPTVEVV